MKPTTVLVVSVVYFAFGMFCAVAFAFLPCGLGTRSIYWENLVFACLLMLPIWLAGRTIRRKRLAWYVGAVVFAPLALCGLLAIPLYVMQPFAPVDARQFEPLWVRFVCASFTVAYVMLYALTHLRHLQPPITQPGLDSAKRGNPRVALPLGAVPEELGKEAPAEQLHAAGASRN